MTTISTNLLKNWILRNVGNELTANEAQKLGTKTEFNDAIEELDTDTLDVADILENTDLDIYEQFATLCTNEKDKAYAKDKEQEKEEQNKVKNKNQAGV